MSKPVSVRSLVLVPALLAGSASAQVLPALERGGSVQAVVGLKSRSEVQPAPLQLRLVELESGLRVECDLATEGSTMSLLFSRSEQRIAVMGIGPALLVPEAVLPMSRRNPLTFACELPTAGLAPGVLGYLQAVAVEPGARVRASGVAPLEVCQAGGLCSAIVPGVYAGPAQISVSPLIAITRLPPFPYSWEVEVQATVPSNDWDLAHHLTRQRANGTDVYLILKEPGPGEGELDVVETHSVLVQLGSRNPGAVTVYLGLTQIYNPPPSSLQFQRAQQ